MQNTIVRSISSHLIFFGSILPFLFISKQAAASHLAGGQITYTHGVGLTYTVTYTFYRDCGGIAAPATVTIVTSSANAGVNFNTVSAAGVNNGNVVPVCPTATTTCSGGATPGRAKWVYTATINLPSQQTDWVFSVTENARNAGITTSNASGQNMYVESTLNNTISPGNNACFFANDPAAFTYINQPFCFNNGAVDIDGDSLAYSLVDPLIAPAAPITWNFGYSATQPVASTPAVTFNPTTGDVCMTPTLVEVTVMAIVVKEYRYGILIGSIERDIQVMIINGADNLPALNGINGTNTYVDTAVVGCAYTFTTSATDANAAQCVTMTSTATTAIPASSFAVANGCPSLTRPTGTFSWTPGAGDAKSYPNYFTVTVRDNFCNIEGQQVKAYGIFVINLNANFTSTAPSCVGQVVNFYSEWNMSNYSYLWNFGAGSVATYAMATSMNPSGVTYTSSGSKTVVLTITTPGGCVITNSQVIIVNPSPTATFTSTAPVCTGYPVDFTNTGSTGAGTTYSWSFGAGASPAASTAENPSGVTYSTSGNKIITYAVTNNFGCVTSSTSTITINQSPVASFSSTAPSCTGSNVDFTNTGTSAGVTWAWDFGSGAAPATSTVQNPTGIVYSTAGIKTVQLVTTLGTCTDTSTQTINISQTPAPSFSSNAPQCVGTAINFTYTGTTGTGWNYFWDFGTGATPALSSAQNPPSVMYSTSGTKTITLTVDNNGTCASTYTTTILISATPVANFSSTAPQCTGLPVDFTNTGTVVGVIWSWTFGSGATPATSILQSPTGITYSVSGTKVVTLTTTNLTTLCTNTYSTTININQSPTSSFVSNAPQCASTGVNFTNTGSTGGGWTFFWDFGVGASPQTSIAEDPAGILYSTAGTKTITLTISDATCSSTSTQVITVNASPVASFTTNAPMCTGDSVNFQNTGTSSGATYAWNFGSGSAPATSTTQSPLGIIYSSSGIKTITLITTLGTCTDTSVQTILINQTPSVGFTSTAPQCVGNSVNFSNTGSTGGNWIFSWSFGAGATPASSSSENPNGIIYATAGTKTITLTISDGSCSASMIDTLNINALPVANAGADTVICNNDSVQIGSAPVAGNTYSWFSPDNTLNNSAIADPIASPIAPSTIYIVTVTDTATGCIKTDSVVVNMLAPLAANAGVDVEICRYDSVQIGAALVTGEMYAWIPSSGLNSTTTPNPVCSPSVTTTYTLSVTGPGCGPVMDEVTVTVHPLPVADAGPNDTITVGSSTQLTATGGMQYTWTPATGLSNVSIYNPVANPIVTTMYYVTVTDVFGCVNIDSVKIYVIEPNFWVPSAFTPNGDMQNDVLFAHGEGINNFEIGVYNRWGELVWSTKDIKVGWDGKRQIGGQELPEGAYVYYVKGDLSNGDVIDKSGLVNLIR